MFERFGSRKIFCIGFNKTGTTSLHDYFRANRLTSLHGITWPQWSHDPSHKRQFRRSTCFSDGQLSNFRNLDAWFPRSVFILNRRAVRPWLRSRVKHVLRLGYSEEFERGIFPAQFGTMGIEFFTDPTTALDKWICERALYHRSARTYFDRRTNFLDVDVTTDDNWAGKVTSFLEGHGFRLAMAHEPPAIHANRRTDAATADRDMAQRWFALADERIAAMAHAARDD